MTSHIHKYSTFKTKIDSNNNNKPNQIKKKKNIDVFFGNIEWESERYFFLYDGRLIIIKYEWNTYFGSYFRGLLIVVVNKKQNNNNKELILQTQNGRIPNGFLIKIHNLLLLFTNTGNKLDKHFFVLFSSIWTELNWKIIKHYKNKYSHIKFHNNRQHTYNW